MPATAPHPYALTFKKLVLLSIMAVADYSEIQGTRAFVETGQCRDNAAAIYALRSCLCEAATTSESCAEACTIGWGAMSVCTWSNSASVRNDTSVVRWIPMEGALESVGSGGPPERTCERRADADMYETMCVAASDGDVIMTQAEFNARAHGAVPVPLDDMYWSAWLTILVIQVLPILLVAYALHCIFGLGGEVLLERGRKALYAGLMISNLFRGIALICASSATMESNRKLFLNLLIAQTVWDLLGIFQSIVLFLVSETWEGNNAEVKCLLFMIVSAVSFVMSVLDLVQFFCRPPADPEELQNIVDHGPPADPRPPPPPPPYAAPRYGRDSESRYGRDSDSKYFRSKDSRGKLLRHLDLDRQEYWQG
eukprot:m.265843 g.265843  ORF g.265843 m.265843 type:complete len:368 (+) comp30505_c0_seq1:133-1236(+)